MSPLTLGVLCLLVWLAARAASIRKPLRLWARVALLLFITGIFVFGAIPDDSSHFVARGGFPMTCLLEHESTGQVELVAAGLLVDLATWALVVGTLWFATKPVTGPEEQKSAR